jgi:predicted unusual protein kinase regulating ubiquinone biosynthesis (AarF/ABC1/UbiB family)
MVDGRYHPKSKRGTKALVVRDENSEDGKTATKKRTLQQIWDAMNEAIDNLQITLVDAGMVAQLNDHESNIFIGLLSCLGEGDGEEAAKYALQFSVENTMADEEKAAFTEEMKNLFAQSCRGYGTNVHMGEVLRGVLGLIRKHHVRIDANFATLVINVLCIESLARRVCPDYNVLDAARPLLQGYRRLAQKSKGSVPRHQSRMFKMWMALNIFKKQVGDILFFAQESKRKLLKQTQIAKSLDPSSPLSPQRSSSTKWAVLAIILAGTTASKIVPSVVPGGVEGIRNFIPQWGATKSETPSDPMQLSGMLEDDES